MSSPVILGTAGHIDHGKTTLVKALTGVDTDRLKEEKERGITIELGFAGLDLPSGAHIGIVDVPGHERFVKNMVAGASGIDIVALIVAADEGVMPQTEEHLEICQLLGVKKGIVALTKLDLVDDDWLELVKDDVKGFLKGSFLENAPVVTLSSVTGDGIDTFINAIDEIVKELPPKVHSGPFRLPIDRVFIKKGFGTVVTGTTISGMIQAGDEAQIYPKDMRAKIRGIQMHGKDSSRAVTGFRTALNLQGVDKAEIKRGDVVAAVNSLRPTMLIDVELIYLKSADKPLRHRTPIRFHCGTKEAIGRVLIQGDELMPGDKAFAQIKLNEPVVCLPSDRFVIRSYSPVRTIGGGGILNPLPKKRKRTRTDLWEEMELLSSGSLSERCLYHLKKAGIRGILEDELGIRAGLYGKALRRTIEDLLSRKAAIALSGEQKRLIHIDEYNRLRKTIIEALRSYHEKNQFSPGASKEELRSRVSRALRLRDKDVDVRLFSKALNGLEDEGEVSSEKEIVRLSQHEVMLEDADDEARERILSFFLRKGLKTVTWKEALGALLGEARLSERQLTAIMEFLLNQGSLVRLRDGLIFHHKVIEGLKKELIRYLTVHEDIGVPEFRDITKGLSRKYLIPLLEHFDSMRLTIRIGDRRRLRGK